MVAFAYTKGGIEKNIRCGICALPPNAQTFTPIRLWAAQNNYTVRQCETLLRKGKLLGFRFRNRYYVKEPNNG